MRLQFILSEILVGLRRNLAMTISVVLVTFVSLTFVGAGALLQMQIGTMKDYWYDRVQVSIFLCVENSEAPTCAEGEVTQAQRDSIVAALEGPLDPYVDVYYYESKAEAYERFREQFSDSSIVDNVTEDQMPDSYRVKLVDPEEYQVVAEYFTGYPGVEEVQDQRRLLDQFFAVLNAFTLVSGIFAAVMIVAAALLIATTIRLSAFSRRRETGIMRLVGASKLLIQTPFVLEGVLAATVGAALATAGLWAAVRYGVEGWLTENLPLFNYIGTSEVLLVAPALFLIGILLAGVSSVVTLGRYLKV
ncbi:ABC transporter permease [Kineosporiaceae bacterium SCSIO 59966]|jgi:cell division transport system permease protein|nr:ABC transporter permease [Kineosporiaceae bacterium SCSIO 59966]